MTRPAPTKARLTKSVKPATGTRKVTRGSKAGRNVFSIQPVGKPTVISSFSAKAKAKTRESSDGRGMSAPLGKSSARSSSDARGMKAPMAPAKGLRNMQRPAQSAPKSAPGSAGRGLGKFAGEVSRNFGRGVAQTGAAVNQVAGRVPKMPTVGPRDYTRGAIKTGQSDNALKRVLKK